MSLSVQIEPQRGATPPVSYRWDTDTDILSAQLEGSPPEGPVATVEVQGHDGSWMILDVRGGRIRGIEVAVWPDVRKLPALHPPSQVEDAEVVLPKRSGQADVGAVEMETRLVAEADSDQRNFHFRVGAPRLARTVRVARDLLVDVDDKNRISGVWLLNVPPCPTEP